MPQIQKTVYFVRHGESVDNIAEVFQSSDAALSERGLMQAELIAERLVHVSFDSLVASSLPRAQQTAAAIARQTNKTVVASDVLVERAKPRSIEGKSWHDQAAHTVYKQWEASLYGDGERVADGETFADIVARADTALNDLLARHETNIVAVSHGHFLRTIVARILLGEALTPQLLRRFHSLAGMENTAITVVQYGAAHQEPPTWRLWTYNDHAHFAD